ncbi:hypothetical protein KPZU09_17760 [Klebsiella pneumoniae]|uniref:Uncharacterized protein n=1 Tax=Klebsiella pneumoniae TaxID=573 RepID=A0A919HPR7_KLEPN|nr:hypothetical protein KPZU09_17760 [Klebsiella pneumoniae]
MKRAAGVQAEGRTVTIRRDGRDRLIALSAEDDSITDAALRQGADLPFACKGGYAPPVNAKCCAVKWRWPPITARKRMSWRRATC